MKGEGKGQEADAGQKKCGYGTSQPVKSTETSQRLIYAGFTRTSHP